jgi:hypothetical protein
MTSGENMPRPDKNARTLPPGIENAAYTPPRVSGVVVDAALVGTPDDKRVERNPSVMHPRFDYPRCGFGFERRTNPKRSMA